MTALSLSNIHKAWGKNTIIENLSLEIASGSSLCWLALPDAGNPRCCGSSPDWKSPTAVNW